MNYYPITVWRSDVLLTGSEDRKGAVIVKPLQCGVTKLFCARCWHHPTERLKQWFDDDAELKCVAVKDNLNTIHHQKHNVIHYIQSIHKSTIVCRKKTKYLPGMHNIITLHKSQQLRGSSICFSILVTEIWVVKTLRSKGQDWHKSDWRAPSGKRSW